MSKCVEWGDDAKRFIRATMALADSNEIKRSVELSSSLATMVEEFCVWLDDSDIAVALNEYMGEIVNAAAGRYGANSDSVEECRERVIELFDLDPFLDDFMR